MTDRSKQIADLSPEEHGRLFQQLMALRPARQPLVGPQERDPNGIELSFAQRRLWFLDQLVPQTAFYNLPVAAHLEGPLDVTIFRLSLDEVIRRHEALRTTFTVVENRPVQIISPALSIDVPVIDMQLFPAEQRDEQVRRHAVAEAQRPFDLAQGPLLRVVLLRLAADDHKLLLTMHHIISDGWSIGVFMRELVTLYEARRAGKAAPLGQVSTPLPLQYADFAIWQRRSMQGAVLEQHLDYWRQQLRPPLPTLALPTDRPRPAIQTFSGARHPVVLDASIADPIDALAQQETATLFMVVLAAFQTLLHRYTRQDDIVVGTAIANRTRAEFEPLIGFFVNMLVLRTDLSGNPTFRALLRRVREVCLQAYAHQDLPFERLVEELQPTRDLSRNPLFQAALVIKNAPNVTLRVADLTLRTMQIDTSPAKFDLTLSLERTATALQGELEYNTDLFDPATVAGMVAHLELLLRSVLRDPDRPIMDYACLSDAEYRQLVYDWNATDVAGRATTVIQSVFEAIADRQPQAIAATFADERLTYQTLNQRANRLAHELRQMGIGPETLVGICLESSLDMLVAVLAVLKAGGAFVPLDPTYPAQRLAHMIADTRLPLILTHTQHAAMLPDQGPRIICLDRAQTALAQHSPSNPPCAVTMDNLAYVIYTSGSTGRPKGVQVTHRGLFNLAAAQIQAFGVEPSSRVLQFASLSFDAAVSEICMALLAGATLTLMPSHSRIPGPALAQLLRDQAITTATLPPSVLALLPHEPLPALKTLIVAGEVCPTDLAARWSAGRHLLNAYGPTEGTVCATIARYDPPPRRAVLGRPIDNVQVYLLDRLANPVALGTPGEICLGGIGLARGYLNQPALTAERFIPNPFGAAGTRLYKTGDLGRYRADGTLEFLGRIDQQVKLRGFRVEPQEIETVISQHPAVQQVVVVARHDPPAEQRLVAYVVLVPEQQLAVDRLRQLMRAELPEYMLPSTIVELAALPLTPSGKVDRHALPAPTTSRPRLDTAYIAPQTETERTILAIWQEVLQLERLGIDDNFFDVGGTSLLAVHLHRRLQAALPQPVSMIDVFQHPTIRSFAESLRPPQDSAAPSGDSATRAESIRSARQRQQLQRQRIQAARNEEPSKHE
ncbi:MAG TPA: amino acid adenylation domain-containing protein [Herpetosiphonaceae bacterium]